MNPLMNVPGLGGYLAGQEADQQRSLSDIQQASGTMGLLANMQKMQQAQQLRAALAQSGGDVEKALEVAIRTGNIDAAHELAPLVKMAQERRSNEATPGLLADIYRQGAPGGAAQQQPQEIGAGQPVSVSGESPAAPAAPQSPDQARQDRIAKLTAMSMIPKYANNPIAQQRIQAEIDKLTSVKPMVEHNFAVAGKNGEPMVQSHISFNDGRDWQPLPGSVPTPKFAKQVEGATPAQEPLVPVKEADGRIIYVPRSQAAGREVGGRVTDINLGKQVQQLGRDLAKADLPPTIAVLRRAEALTPDLAQYVTGPMSALPDRAIPQAARDARQDVQRLFNIVLKQRSGAAVTNQEMDRLKQEFGSGLIKTPIQLTTAIGRMREIIESHYSSIAGGYGKDALDTYNANIEAVGGAPFEMRPRPAAGPTEGQEAKSKSGKDMVFRSGRWAYK